MLLGQIVAISFAQNLFFATVLVSTWPESETKGREWAPPLVLEIVPVALSLLSTALVPSVAHNRYFMLILLIPHLLLFVPAILRPDLSSRNTGENTVTRRYTTFFQWFLLSCVIVQGYSTYSALQSITQSSPRTSSLDTLSRTLLRAFIEHPAASSVSWDVVCCTIGVVTWATVHGCNWSRMLGRCENVGNPVKKHK